MGMPGKPCQVICGNIVAEIVEQEERIEFGSGTETESAAQMDARAFKSRLGRDDSFNRPKRHSYCALTNSTSTLMVTSSPTMIPPVSRVAFQVRPKSLRLIFVVAEAPMRM